MDTPTPIRACCLTSLELTLPSGVLDLAHDIPEKDVALIGTKEMLVARDGLHPALVALLFDAAREMCSGQEIFRGGPRVPGTSRVDLRVSADADRHKRFGPSSAYQYLPFWLATLAERAIIILLPLAAVLFPVFQLPAPIPPLACPIADLSMVWRTGAARAGRRYPYRRVAHGKVASGLGAYRTSRRPITDTAAFASEAYTLRGHIDIVRNAVMARIGLSKVASG